MLARTECQNASCPTCGQTLEKPRRVLVNFYTGIASYAGHEVQLPPFESVIFYELAKAYPDGCTYEHLMHVLYGDRIDGGPDGAHNSLTTHLCHLRRDLRNAAFPASIITRWGYGLTLKLAE